MVHIEKVEIYGFKSFGFRNTTVKLEPGLVSVSGPNGSGKSSILDAIIFALGEKSPKTLRVDRLKSLIHDVDKSPGGTRVARVSVHLDNAERRIPVDSDRVTVTRTMDGGGESAYYVNRQKTTRSRIHDALGAGNAAPNQLNVVQQGTITRISEFSAEEKREAVEDLLGLSAFDEKRELAARELDNADRRLEVSLARMGEVRNRITELEGERNHVVRGALLRGELRRYGTVLAARELARVEGGMRDMEARLGDVDAEAESGARRLEGLRNDMKDVQSARTQHMTLVAAGGRANAEAGAAVSRALEEYRDAEAAAKSAERRLEQADARIKSMRAEFAGMAGGRRAERIGTGGLLRDAKGARARLEDITGRLAAVDGERAAALERQGAHAARRAEAERELGRLRAGLAESERRRAEADIEARDASRRMGEEKRRLAALREGMERAEGARRRLGSWTARRDGEMERDREVLGGLRSGRDALVSSMRSVDELLERAGRAAAAYDSKMAVVRGAMHEDYAVGRLRTGGADLGVLGLAYELLSWPAECERAVMASASDWLRALVVRDADTMGAVYGAARSLRLARVRIIPMDLIRGAREGDANAGPLLSGRVSCEGRFLPLRAFLFRGTVLADSLRDARAAALAGVRAVTLAGECVEAGGHVVDWGSRITNLAGIISAGAHMDGLRRAAEALRAARAGRAGRLRDVEARAGAVSGRLEAAGGGAAAARAGMERLEARLEAARGARGTAEGRLARLAERLPLAEAARREAEREADGARKAIAAQEGLAPANESAGIASELQRLNRAKADLERERAEADSAHRRAKTAHSESVARSLGLARQAARLARDHAVLVGERRDLAARLPALREEAGKKRAAAEGVRQRQQEAMQEGSSALEGVRRCDAELERLRAAEKSLDRTLSTLQRRRDSISRSLEGARQRSAEIAGTLPRELPPDPGADVEPLIAALQAELDALPPLNANAPTAYPSVSNGYRSMSERKNVLERERGRIVSFMDGVERDKRQTYLDAFDVVDKEIRAIFGRMSGANAWLELEDEDDVFGSGITYMVQFPGKPKRTSASLSGGEKTLAAIVFVLALQKLSPSPFYLFDEVDAHLDAPNSERLAAILGERSQNSQFIIVSLKEFVVQKAGLIYGVYPKNGVSQVVPYRDRRVRPAAV